MSSYVYVEDNGATACSSAGCSGRGNATARGNAPAAVGGSATLNLLPLQINIGETNVVFASVTMDVPSADKTLKAQTLATKFRTLLPTGGSVNLTEVYVCRVDSGCNSLQVCGSATGLAVNLASAAEFTQNVTIPADVTFNATDLLMVLFVGTNSSSMSNWTTSMAFNPAVSMTVEWGQAAGRLGDALLPLLVGR